jgi:hypothetical protein
MNDIYRPTADFQNRAVAFSVHRREIRGQEVNCDRRHSFPQIQSIRITVYVGSSVPEAEAAA